MIVVHRHGGRPVVRMRRRAQICAGSFVFRVSQSEASAHVIVLSAPFSIWVHPFIAQHPVFLDSPTICPACPETAGVIRGFIHAAESQATAHRLRLQLCRTGMQRLAPVTEWGTIQQVNVTTHTPVDSWNANPFYF